MKTSINLSLTIIILSCFFMSCNNESTDTIKTGTVDRLAYYTIYKMEVINNTDTEVTLSIGHMDFSERSGIGIGLNKERYTIAGGAAETILFSWAPKSGDYFTAFAEEEERIEIRKELMMDFAQDIQAFFIGIRNDELEHYIAGWPESFNLPQFLKITAPTEANKDFILDTGKIIQYGVGYGVNNWEIRVETNPDYGQWFYWPNIISYVNDDGQIVEKDFDNAVWVFGETVLTIDAPDKIMFKTQELSIEQSEDMHDAIVEWYDAGHYY